MGYVDRRGDIYATEKPATRGTKVGHVEWGGKAFLVPGAVPEERFKLFTTAAVG